MREPSASPQIGQAAPFVSVWAGVALGLAFVAGALALTWPLAASLREALPGTLGDPLLNATILAWNAQWLLGERGGSFWDVPIFHPHGNALAYSEHLIGETLFVWPLFALTSNALLTYNVSLLLSFVVCGLASYVWIHALTGRRDVALVFSLALTFSPFRMGAQLSRLQMLTIGWLPLALWAIHRYGETGKARYAWWIIASLTLLVLSNMYMLFLAVLPLALLMAYAISDARGRRKKVAAGFAIALAATGVLLTPVVQPYRTLDREMALVHEDDHAAEYSAHLTSYASVHESSAWLPWVRTEMTGDQALYPGMVLLLPLVAIATFGLRRSFAGRGRVALLYAAMAAGALWLSFGPEIRTADGVLVTNSPYGWLREHVPGFSAVRAPGRFAAIVALALAALGAVASARLTTRVAVNARAALAAAAIGVIVIEAWPAALPVEPLSPEGRSVDRELYAWLARQPAAALLELPASPITAQVPSVELFHQFATLQHPHRLLNGYSGFNSPLSELFEDRASPFIDLARLPDGIALLQSVAVRFVVIHPHDYAIPSLATELVGRMRTLPGVRAEHRVGIDHVFELEPP